MRLKDKIAIVTGAGSGIGRASALRFAAEGARVIAADINAEGAAQTVDMLQADAPGSIDALQVDVSQASQVEDLMTSAVERHGRLDVVYSNAAIMRDGSVVDISEEDWDAQFAVNVKGTFLCGKYGIPAMCDTGGGSMVITASCNSFYAESDIAGYCASKGAVIQLTRAMAIDHGPQGVRVNCICPGWIETPMSQPYLEEVAGGREFAGKIAPLGRIGQPEEVAALALFLASDESRFITGAAYTVDGGLTIGMTKAIALV